MSDTSTTFTASETDAAKARTMSQVFEEQARAMARDMIEVGGLSPSEAGSLVANMLLRAAWIVAAQGRLAEEQEPRPEHFAIVARKWADRVLFQSKFDVRRHAVVIVETEQEDER